MRECYVRARLMFRIRIACALVMGCTETNRRENKSDSACSSGAARPKCQTMAKPLRTHCKCFERETVVRRTCTCPDPSPTHTRTQTPLQRTCTPTHASTQRPPTHVRARTHTLHLLNVYQGVAKWTRWYMAYRDYRSKADFSAEQEFLARLESAPRPLEEDDDAPDNFG